jgi:hypothetical protein
MSLQIPIFTCQWVKHPHGIEVDEYGFTIIDLGNVSHKDEPWVLTSTIAQVFYCHTRFLSENRMLIVCVPRNQIYTHTIQKMDTE